MKRILVLTALRPARSAVPGPSRGLSAWSGSQQVTLNYQEPPPPGKRNGRYINQPDRGDAVDLAKNFATTMHDARALAPPASLETMGFALASKSSAVGRGGAQLVGADHAGARVHLIRVRPHGRVVIMSKPLA